MDSAAVGTSPAAAGPFRLQPFHGLSLAPRRVGDPASARAFGRPYSDVADRLRRWQQQGHLLRDPEPAVYVHEYTADGLTIRGLVAGLDVSHRTTDPDAAVVLPHEGVHERQARELAARMADMDLNPAPILLVHRGPHRVRELVRSVLEGPADREFRDRAQRHNRVWGVRDPELLTELAAGLAHARPLIADGHHRYAAYLRLQERRPGTPADRGLAMLVDQDDTPMFLGAIHRTLPQTRLTDLRDAAEGAARFVPASRAAAMAALGPSTMVATDGRSWACLELDPACGLAVQVLHERILRRLPRRGRRVTYHHAVDDALARLDPRSVAVLMPAVEFDQVGRVAAEHRLLPEKATSFQPKPSLGVLMRSLLDE